MDAEAQKKIDEEKKNKDAQQDAVKKNALKTDPKTDPKTGAANADPDKKTDATPALPVSAASTPQDVADACKLDTNICSDFSASLVTLCKQFGGGEPCDSEVWSRAFYNDLVEYEKSSSDTATAKMNAAN